MRKVALISLAILFICISAGAEESLDPYSGARQVGNEFVNVYPVKEKRFSDLLKWRMERRKMLIPDAEAYSFEAAANDPEFLRTNKNTNTYTWIGHATALIQINGVNILTDPQFSEYASPVQWAGPKRALPPGLSIEELPEIDIVLLSHDHYDSLDLDSINALVRRKGGEKTLFAVPLKLKNWFIERGVQNVIEFDWWQTHKEGKAEITAVPAQHWSKRYPLSRNRTLWAGWVVKVEDFKFYFIGDSGYAPIFKDITKQIGPVDLAMVPIGAYEPRWFMKDSHMNPEEAAKVHKDVRSRLSVAMHWGTFVLTDEPLDEPPGRLRDALRNEGIRESEFRVLRHGETIMIKTKGRKY
jgi:L-ascorbate metabolism protein UlaG (beta-lactamase superfamily)